MITIGLACIVASIPIVVNTIPFTVTQWITLFVFLKYGLFAEMILGQIITFVFMLKLRLSKEKVYNFPLNSVMFILVSLLSGFIFYLLGGKDISNDSLSFQLYLLAGIYLLVYFMINQLLYNASLSLLFGIREPLITKAFLWEGLTQLISFPVGITLYILYDLVGAPSFLFVGIPILSLQLFLQKYNLSQEINQYLQKAVEFGHRLTERLNAEEVIKIFCENLLKMFPADYIYIFDNINNERLEAIHCYEKGVYKEWDFQSIKKGEGIVGKVLASRQAIFYRNKQQWKDKNADGIPQDIESILAVPIIKNNTVSGVLFLGSMRKMNTYEKYHLMIIDILCSYFAVALENARNYEKTKTESERDPLTNLYNARVCSEKLKDAFLQLQEGKRKNISLLMLDLDHFKLINDYYGHQSGDEVLIQVADLLKKIVGNRGLLTRYGGEEFVIILPEVGKEEANLLGEHIRQTIENYHFTIHDNLADIRKERTMKITVSIGVASSPTDTDDAMSLIRYADRALYIGAKQVGRNKVASYVG